MAQADNYVIEDVDGATFLVDINTILAAIATINAGGTEPTTSYAYMLWADTGSGKLKQRNAANDAWIEKGSLADVDWGLLNKAGGSMTGLLNLAAGADIASASTVDLTAATGNCPKITGTTAVEAWTMNTGQQVKAIAAGALPLTYHATTNNIEGGASHTCEAGDIINLVKGLDGVIRVRIDKQNGAPVVPVQFASASEFNAGTEQTKALNSKIVRENAWVYGSLIATTSGDPLDILTGLPSWVTEVELIFDSVSLSGTNSLLIQAGTSGGYVTSGYSSVSVAHVAAANQIESDATSFNIRLNTASHVLSGVMRLVKQSGNVWESTHILRRGGDVADITGAGVVDLGAALTRIRANTGGSDTFDSGSIQGRYR